MISDRFIDCLQKTTQFNRLYQIIYSIHFIAIKGIFSVCSGEDDQCILRNTLSKLHTGDTGHLNIKENQIDCVPTHKGGCSHSVIKATRQL